MAKRGALGAFGNFNRCPQIVPESDVLFVAGIEQFETGMAVGAGFCFSDEHGRQFTALARKNKH